MTWQKTKPAGSDSIKSSDQNLRDNFAAIEEGLVPFDYIRWDAQGSNPSAVADHLIAFSKDVSSKAELHTIDEDSNVIQLTSAGSLGSTSTAMIASQINLGDDALLHYKEGTFTPTLTAGTPGTLSVGYTTQQGNYTRIGNLVHIDIKLHTSSITQGTASGALKIGGLPYTAANDDTLLCVELYDVNHNADTCNMNAMTQADTTLVFREQLAGVNGQTVQIGDADEASTIIRVSGCYKV